ncbi:Nudix family hydrolase [Larsenimonas rhizosphaerae]|uniref:8-oxo-dGTP diphosphatase n=1 Tax=Larsenimonas rhizosphaerae TaxID=2944682 RepID=A0AA41ZL23_9GAMM|nr:Nudix family hydrolase [Larsenimonas rhizosphaerae]MCM2131033.1 Nudix family hydrolase [Larsenimonas rhizosphaerae]MCX2523738.1 Nudix family hydrolase [Larsenimonas rhizosphaerae]
MPKRRVHVAAAAIYNDQGQVLIARRPSIADQGGLWEFPGGKLEVYETGREALKRELKEELGIEIEHAQPLIRVHYEYPDKFILLDVWEVRQFSGEPYGCEGQAVRWVDIDGLSRYPFPPANGPIVKAVGLPHAYVITDEIDDDEAFVSTLTHALENCNGLLVQLRAKSLSAERYLERAHKALELCRAHGARLVLNGAPELLNEVDADGIHLTSKALMSAQERTVPADKWLSASTHNKEQLDQAARLGCDFVTLSPLRDTPSHPDAVTIGWHDFQQMVEYAAMPVFGLGGTTLDDIDQARAVGAQGVASIRSFLPD